MCAAARFSRRHFEAHNAVVADVGVSGADRATQLVAAARGLFTIILSLILAPPLAEEVCAVEAAAHAEPRIRGLRG